VSIADIAPIADETLTERDDKAKASAEEIVRKYLEQIATIFSALGVPFTFLPKIESSPLIRGQEPETDDQKRADISSPWSYEKGSDVAAQLLISGSSIDRGSKPDKTTCNEAFVIRSFWEDKTIRSCDGYGGPKDSNNDVCKEAVKNAGKMAAEIPCPADCNRREETEIWRGWRCFEDKPDKGSYAATCAVQSKLLCRPEVQT
jgi:hypothetical protein